MIIWWGLNLGFSQGFVCLDPRAIESSQGLRVTSLFFFCPGFCVLRGGTGRESQGLCAQQIAGTKTGH